jgi:hypothetical protein
MLRKVAMTIMALSVGGCFILTSPPASAQMGQQQQQGKTQGQSRAGGSAVAPRSGGVTRTVTPHATRTVTPRATRTVTPRATRTVTPRATRTVTPRATRTVTPRATRTVTPRATRTVTPKATRTVTPKATRTVTPKATRTVTPRGTRNVTAGKLRGMPVSGAGRTTIRGQNYSVWRGRHRVRHGSGWWTFVALSTLGAIAIDSNEYYPYAYISAPEPYCEGLTEDGCQLMWQEVETIEGDVVNQCVAYCPWQ